MHALPQVAVAISQCVVGKSPSFWGGVGRIFSWANPPCGALQIPARAFAQKHPVILEQ